MNQYLEKIEVDNMPRQVAIEILCSSKELGNPMRKKCMRALETHYTSNRQPKTDKETKVLAARLQTRPWAFLLKIKKRCESRRAEVQKQHDFSTRRKANLEAKTGKPNPHEIAEILLHERAIAALNLRAARLDLVWEGVTDEMDRRKKNILSLAEERAKLVSI